MIEEICRFGRHAQLSGILVRPGSEKGSNETAVIFITAGLLHKPGPYRLYTELSRSVAVLGIPALRFDLAGIGESASVQNGSAELAAISDVREAMDTLSTELDCSRFILAGLCSGAEVAHRTAIADTRVCGVIALDGYIAPTFKFRLHHYLPRLFSVRKWRDFIVSKANRLYCALRRTDSQHVDRSEVDALAFWEGLEPTRDELAIQFQSLVDRGTRLLQVYSGGSGYCSYERQFRDAFPDVDFGRELTVRYLRHADHMYMLQTDRRELSRLVCDWVGANFVAASASRSPDIVRAMHQHPLAADAIALSRFANEQQRTASMAERRRFK